VKALLGRVNGPLLGAFFVVGASTLWGTTGTVATFAPSVSPLAIGAVAMGVGGLLQALYAVQPIANHWDILRGRWLLVALGAAAVAVYPLAFYSSMHLCGVALGTVVSIGSAPLASAVIERLAERKALTRRWMLGAVTGVAGAGLLCFAGDSAERPGGLAEAWAVPAGVVLGLAAGVTYAVYSWAAHRLISGGVSSRAAMGAVFGLGGVLLMPVLAVTGRPLLESWGNFTVGAYMALIPMFAGYVLFGWGLARVRASTATGLSLMETVVAAVLAVVVVGERLPALGWLGVAMVLASLFVLTPRQAGSQDDGSGQAGASARTEARSTVGQ
jgi:DME family drug/metabolite transporter